jgi:hypothetical protein
MELKFSPVQAGGRVMLKAWTRSSDAHFAPRRRVGNNASSFLALPNGVSGGSRRHKLMRWPPATRRIAALAQAACNCRAADQNRASR